MPSLLGVVSLEILSFLVEELVMAESVFMAGEVFVVESVVTAEWVVMVESVVMAESAVSEDHLPWMDLSVILDGVEWLMLV